jgi:hypothetical protein
MTATYTDIIKAMVKANKRTSEVDVVVLTEESMDTFLKHDKLSKQTQEMMEEEIGHEWELEIESGDDDYLLFENGERINL